MKKPKGELRSRRDTELSTSGLPADDITTMQAVTLIVDKMTRPEGGCTVEAVAAELGYSPFEIKKIINSPQWHDIVMETAKAKVAPLLLRSIKGIEQRMDDPKLTPLGSLAINKELRQTLRDLVELTPKQQSEDETENALRQLAAMSQARKSIQESRPEIEDAESQRDEVVRAEVRPTIRVDGDHAPSQPGES